MMKTRDAEAEARRLLGPAARVLRSRIWPGGPRCFVWNAADDAKTFAGPTFEDALGKVKAHVERQERERATVRAFSRGLVGVVDEDPDGDYAR